MACWLVLFSMSPLLHLLLLATSSISLPLCLGDYEERGNFGRQTTGKGIFLPSHVRLSLRYLYLSVPDLLRLCSLNVIMAEQ